MPDLNKLQRLSDICYTVQPCCGVCHYGDFIEGSVWGKCKVESYEHEKHGTKNLSVHWAGKCGGRFVMSTVHLERLRQSGFDRFLEGG